MKWKKLNAALGLLSIVLLLAHVGYSVYAYLAMYYNPLLKQLTAYPFMVTASLHAVLGMIIVFTHADGSSLHLYPRQNLRTVLQRVSASLILPLLILHINTFGLLNQTSAAGQWFFFALLILGEILFFAVVITHVAVSLTPGLITLGRLSSPSARKRLDRALFLLGAAAFAFSVYAVLRGQLAMFVH